MFALPVVVAGGFWPKSVGPTAAGLDWPNSDGVVVAAGCVVGEADELDCPKIFGVPVLVGVDCPNKFNPVEAVLDWKPEPVVAVVCPNKLEPVPAGWD